MKCDWVRDNITFYLYDELADDARYEFEQHVARCPGCEAELEAAKKLHASFAAYAVAEPSPNLLASSRMRLQESLETAEQGGFWSRLVFDPGVWLRQARFSPALAAAILMVGFAGGVGATYQLVKSDRAEGVTAAANTPASAGEASIAGIRSVTQDPASNQVNISYDSVSTRQVQGSLNDQRIQALLLYAARNNFNSGVRMDSVDLLTKSPEEANVREALIYALRYDSNPGVRLKALDALGPFARSEVRVRDAILEALMNDSNAGLRIQTLRWLEPARGDTSVRIVLAKLAHEDKSEYIRNEARKIVAESPQMD